MNIQSKNMYMKATTLYWISTSTIALFLFWSAYTYLFSKATIEGVRELGLPDYLRVQLACLKLIAMAALLIPKMPLQIKEWAYAGVGLFFITAIVAHTVHKDPFIITIVNLVLIGLLITSNIYLHKSMA